MPMRTRLRELMEAANLSQEELAARAGVSRTTVGHFCRDRTQHVSLRTLERFCRALGVTPGEFFELSEESPRPTASGSTDGQRSGHS